MCLKKQKPIWKNNFLPFSTVNSIKADVVVVGAGTSGVPAAIASARAGAKTILLEQRAQVGGTQCDGLGFPVCGLFECDTTRPPNLINQGLASELAERVTARNSQAVEAMGRVYVLRCRCRLFQSIYRSWIANESNLQLVSQASSLKVKEADGRISSIGFQFSEKKSIHIETGAVIDCTGSGAVIEASSAERITPTLPSLAGFSLRVCNVIEGDLLAIKVPYILRKAVEEGELPFCCCFTVFTPESDGGGLCKLSLPPEFDLAAAVRLSNRVLEVLCRTLPEFRSAECVESSPLVMQREGVRLRGQVVLTKNDVLSGRRVDDAVARGSWPIERWGAEKGPQYDYIKSGFSYDIPLRALRSVNIENCWAAGRVLSADSDALASVRVIGTAIATGEAAGKAAAESVL